MGAWQEVVLGLTRPAWEALASAGVTVLALAGAAVASLDPATVRDQPGVFVQDGKDSYGFATSAVLAAQARDPGPWTVVLLGGSGLREAVSSEAALEAAIEEGSGRDVQVHLLSTSAQTIDESRAILRSLPPGGSVVIGVGANRLVADDPELARFGLDLPGVPHGARTGVFGLDHAAFYAPRAWGFVRSRLWGPVPEATHQYRGQEPKGERSWARYRSQVTGRYPRLVDETFATLSEMVSEAAGWDVTLLETPRNPRKREFADIEAVEADFAVRLDAYVAASGVRRLELDDEAGLVEDHFVDWIHLRDADACDRYTRTLGSALAATLASP